jgi:hypothetical protein
MLYKTIVFELLAERPQLHRQLSRSRRLLQTLESMAAELRDRHMDWTRALAQSRPGSVTTQLSAEALELAIRDLEFPTTNIE